MRRVVAVIAMLAAIVLLGFTFTEHVHSRAADAQKIADQYRGLMSPAGLAALSTGFDSVKAAGAELGGRALPDLQQKLGLPADQFTAYVGQHLPGIQAFAAQSPAVVALVGPVIARMQAEETDYHQADQIPTGWLSMTSAFWLFVAIGVLLLGLGLWGLRSSRLPIAGLTIVGLALVVAPLVIGIPGKVDAARRVTRLGAVGLAPSTGRRAVAATALFDGMAHDVSTALAPALASDPAEFAAAYPALATFTTTWESGISAQSHVLSESQVALAPAFGNAHRLPLAPIPWLFIGPGLLLAVLGALALGESLGDGADEVAAADPERVTAAA